jgi:hypothetical protein
MFDCDEGQEDVVRSKYALTLLGPPTLLLQASRHTLSIHEAGEARFLHWRSGCDGVTDDSEKRTQQQQPPEDDEIEQAYEDLRGWLAGQYESAPRVAVGEGEIVRFSWGHRHSPLHSEPDLTCDRVFMTVLFGSESELRRMCAGRNEEYGKFIEA